MKHSILILTSLFVFLACNNEQEQRIAEQQATINAQNTTIEEQENQILNQQEIIHKFEMVSNINRRNIDDRLECYFDPTKVKQSLLPHNSIREYIFQDKANIYCAPDTNSNVLSTVTFGNLRSPNDYFQYKYKGWYTVNISSGSGNKIGYIQEQAYSNYLTNNSSHNLTYYGKITQETDDKRAFTIKRYNRKKNEVTQIYKTAHYYNGHEIERLYNTTLEGVSFMMHFSTLYDACPSSFHEEIIVEANGKLTQLWSDGYIYDSLYDDDVEETTYNIYLPIELSDEVVLAPYGKFEDILQRDLSHDVFNYDGSVTDIPIRDLVVTQFITHFKDGTKNIENSYHRWTGTELVLEKKE